MKRSGRTEIENDEDEKEDIWTEISFHADGYDQSDVDDMELRPMERSGGAKYENNGNEFENTEIELFRYVNGHN
jgi:hypothetical protein